MKKTRSSKNSTRLNKTILTATSLTALSAQHELMAANGILAEGSDTVSGTNESVTVDNRAKVVLSADMLSALDATSNQLTADPTAEVVDLKLMPLSMQVGTSASNPLDLSGYTNAREFAFPVHATKLYIKFPAGFGKIKDNKYGKIILVPGAEPENELKIPGNNQWQIDGEMRLDAKAVPAKKVDVGPLVAIPDIDFAAVEDLTLYDTVQNIDPSKPLEADKKINVVLKSATSGTEFKGIPTPFSTSPIASHVDTLDLSSTSVNGKDVNVSGMQNITTVTTKPKDAIGNLTTSGGKIVTTNAGSVETTTFTSAEVPTDVIEAAKQSSKTVSVQNSETFRKSYAGLTNLDFTKLSSAHLDELVDKIHSLFITTNPETDAMYVPMASVTSIKISSNVLTALMARMGISNLNGFSSLKRLDIVSPSGTYETIALTKSQLPASLEAFYSANLVVRKGTLTENLQIDKKFSGAELDLSQLELGGHTISISDTYTASKVNTLRLTPELLEIAAAKNLIEANITKAIIVTGTVTVTAPAGTLTTTNLQNVGTIDLKDVLDATSFTGAIDVSAHTKLANLYLPSGFDLTAANILTGVANGEVTVYLSGAYANNIALDASYDNTILDFTAVTGGALFQVGSGVRGLRLSQGVGGINVGAAATAGEFDLSALTHLRVLTNLPTAATLLSLNNSDVTTPITLNLATLLDLQTLNLGSSHISSITLPNTATLTKAPSDNNLNMGAVADLAEIRGLNELLAQGQILRVTFPDNPAITLTVNLVDTVGGIEFFNLGRLTSYTLDDTYTFSNANMWPAVINKTSHLDWENFFNYLTAPTGDGGMNSPANFDLSGQMIKNQDQATAFITALNSLDPSEKNAVQTLIVRLDPEATGTISFSTIDTTDFSNAQLKIIVDKTTGSDATVTLPGAWTTKTKTYNLFGQIDLTDSAAWANYLNYRFSPSSEKGQGASSLDLSETELTAAQWLALMTAFNSLSSDLALLVETLHFKLVADDNYNAPVFTTTALPNATSIVVDVTGVKNTGSQISITGLPNATLTRIVEQRVSTATAVDRSSAASWQGYIEHLLSSISGNAYTLDLTASELELETTAELTHLNTALAALSDANKAKVAHIKLKIKAGNRGGDFTISTDVSGFSNLASFVVDATDAKNGVSQCLATFNLSNAPGGITTATYVTALNKVVKDAIASWNYYLAHRLATAGVLLTHLDISAVTFASQAEVSAFLASLNGQSDANKLSVESLKIKLASDYSNTEVKFDVDLGSGEISGLDHANFAVEVDRNGAKAGGVPVSIVYGTNISGSKTTIKDTAFTGLGNFNSENAHQWLGYIRTLLSAVSAPSTTSLNLSTHNTLAVDSTGVDALIVALNALPTADKAKIAELRIKLKSGDFDAAVANFSTLSGLTALTDLIVERNNALSTADLFSAPVTVSAPDGVAITIHDSELRTVSSVTDTTRWLGYLRFVLNGMEGTENTVDLSAFAISSADAATALHNALNALPSAEKDKVKTLKLKASGDVTLGTGVTGFGNLTHVIVDQTTAPTADVSFANGFGTTAQKAYVTSAAAAQTNNAWAKYIDYVMSNTADGGLGLSGFDLTALELTNAHVGQFLTAAAAAASAANITGIALKLAPTFGNDALALSGYAALDNANLVVIINRNGASSDGQASSAPVSITYGATLTDDKVSISDATATTVADKTSAQNWLSYLTYLTSQAVFDATDGLNGILDLSSQVLTDADEALALSTALPALDTALKAKIKTIKLKASADVTVSTDFNAGFATLTAIELDKPAANTLTVSTPGAAQLRIASLSKVNREAAADWRAYIQYLMKDQATNDFDLDMRSTNLAEAELPAFVNALVAISNDSSASTVRGKVQKVQLKLDPGAWTENVTSLGEGWSGFMSNITTFTVDVTGVTKDGNQLTVGFHGDLTDQSEDTGAIVTTLASVDKDSQTSWTYYFNSAAMTAVDVSAVTLNSTEATAFLAALGTGITAKTDITSLTMKLASGDFGAESLTLDGTDLTGLQGADKVSILRNGAINGTDPVVINLSNGLTTAHVRVTDSKANTLTDPENTQEWLKYLTYKLDGSTPVIDLSAIELDSEDKITALNLALNAVDANLKSNAVRLLLTVTEAGEIGTGVTGFGNLTHVIVDQTSAPTVAVSFANGFGDVRKAYVTSAAAAQENDVWAKYIDYVMSNTADGGLGLSGFDLTALELTNAHVGQFLTAAAAAASAANITGIALKLAPTFGNAALNLSGYDGFTNLTTVSINRNGAVDNGSPVTITFGSGAGKVTDAITTITDPTASSIVDTANAGQWLGYITGILNDAATGTTLDLSNISIDDTDAVTAFNAALAALDSTLAEKISVLRLKITVEDNITLGIGTSGFSSMARIELISKPAANTVALVAALSGKRTYLTDFSSVNMSDPADWERYLDYQISSTGVGGQGATSLNLNSRTFADQAAVNALFAGLNNLNNKEDLSLMRITLADNAGNDIVIGVADGAIVPATGLSDDLRVIVNAGNNTGTTHAGTNGGEILADNLIVLDSDPAISISHITYQVEQAGFTGTLSLSGSTLNDQGEVDAFITTLNSLPDDIKAKIKTINMKLVNGNFGSSSATFGALEGSFAGVTFNVDRNGAIDGVNDHGPLVTTTNNTGHTVNLTDAEYHNMGAFNNESSADWVGYLTHELNSAPGGYTLDLSTHSALIVDSENSLSALNEALKVVTNKTKVLKIKIRSSVAGEIGTAVTGFDTLTHVMVDYAAANITAMTAVFNGGTQTPYHYMSDETVVPADATDWARFWDYRLNTAADGGLAKTDVTVNQRLSAANLTALLGGLDNTTAKTSLRNLTLNLASDVDADIDFGIEGLDDLEAVVLYTNGSAAKITPVHSFIGKTRFNSISNVKADSSDSWAAYLAGQANVVNIDIREVELATQAELTAFLTALNANPDKSSTQTLKLKLKSDYAGTVNFGVDLDLDTVGTQAIAGLDALLDAGVDVHRNGSITTVTAGGDIIDAKISIVDLTAASLTDRSSSSAWTAYLTNIIESFGVNDDTLDLSIDSDTYLRTNAHVDAFIAGLNNLSPANKGKLQNIKVKLAAGATWTNITDLGEDLTDFVLNSFVVDATGAYVAGGAQVTLGLHVDINATTSKVIVTDLSAVDKDSQDSWGYYFNSAARTDVDVSEVTLNSTEMVAFLAVLGNVGAAKADITAVTVKLDPAFGAGALEIDGAGFNATATAFNVQRNGAVHGDPATPINITLINPTGASALTVSDPTIADANSVLKTSASSWLAYLTGELDAANAGAILDLTAADLVVTTAGQAIALSSALDALDRSLKAKVGTLKLKSSTNITISSTLTVAAGFTGLTVIELEKPAANTITISTPDITTELRIAALANVKRDVASDWSAYIAYAMKDLAVDATDFDLQFAGGSALNLNATELTAFMSGLNAISDTNKTKIQSVHINLLPENTWANNLTVVGEGFVGFDNLQSFVIDVTNAKLGDNSQLAIGFHADLGTGRAIVSSLDAVDRGTAESWVYLLNNWTLGGTQTDLIIVDTPLTEEQLGVLNTALNTFSAVDANADKLTRLYIKVSGAASAATINMDADLTAQTSIDDASKFVVDVSGFTFNGAQAVVTNDSAGTDKAIELRVSGAEHLIRTSTASWTAYLNHLNNSQDISNQTLTIDDVTILGNGIGEFVDLDFTGQSSAFLRSQADVNAFMAALDNFPTLHQLEVRLAAGNMGSDIVFGNGFTKGNPTMTIIATGAKHNNKLLQAADIHYAGTLTSTNKTVTQAFAATASNATDAAAVGKVLAYMLSPTVDGGLGLNSLSFTPTNPLTAAGELTAYMTALQALNIGLKVRLNHLYFDLSDINGPVELGTGVSGFTALDEVSYIRTTGAADATAAVVGAGDFTNKLQRLRTEFDANAIASDADMAEYLRYVLMDDVNGGLEQTLVNLTSFALTSAQAANLNTAIGSLPAELKSRITEIRLSLNAATAVTFDAAGLTNLATVKYLQSGDGVITWADAGGFGFGTATKIRFRALNTVNDITNATQWEEYVNYVLTSSAEGGLGQTTFDVRTLVLNATGAGNFLTALDEHASANTVTEIKLALAINFGATALDLSGYSNLDALVDDSVIIYRNGAVDNGSPVTITYGGSFTDAKVRIQDPALTDETANKDNTIQEWLVYLTDAINVGGFNGLLSIAPGVGLEFASQAQIYTLFDALEALDPGLKALVTRIHVNIANILTGIVKLMRTDDAALTGFNNLTHVTYERDGVDANIDGIIADLNTQLSGELTTALNPGVTTTWPYADVNALTAAVNTVLEHHTVRSAITNADAVALDTALMTQLEAGITLPDAGSRTTDIGTAVDTAVDNGTTGGAYNLIAALTPADRLLTDVTTTVYPNAGNGTLYTELTDLSWLVGDWTANAVAWNGSLANIDAVINQAITDENTTITNIFRTGNEIRDAVKARIVADLIPAVGTSVGGEANTLAEKVNAAFTDAQVSTAITQQNAANLNARLNMLLEASLSELMPWVKRNDNGTDHIGNWVNGAVFLIAETANLVYNWDAAAIKAGLLTELSTRMQQSFENPLYDAVNTAFADLVTGGGNELAHGFTPNKVAISAAVDGALQTTFTSGAFPWYASANITAIDAMVTAAFANGTDVDTALDTLVTAGSAENADKADIATTFMTALKTYFDDDTRMALPTADSLFGASVDATVLAVNLDVEATTVTTAVDGVDETLQRYRTDVDHLTDTESSTQWMEYLSYQLLPAAQGGLGATTIDISARPIGRDHFSNFMAALNDNRFDDYRPNITSIKIALNNSNMPVQLNGGGKTYNDNLQIIAIMDQDPNQTVTLGTDGDGLKDSGGQDLPNSIIDFRITSAPAVTATAVAWERYLNQQFSTTYGGAGTTTLDLSDTHEFANQAQLNAFFAGLDALDGSAGKANKNVLTALTLKLATGDFGSTAAHIGQTGADDVTGLNANINVTIHRNNARNGANSYDPILIIEHSIIDALSSVAVTTIDISTNAIPSPNTHSSEWLEYLTYTLSQDGFDDVNGNNGLLDLTGAGLELTNIFVSTALANALKALPTTLKNKVGAIQLKASADVTVGTGVTGFDNLVWVSLDKPANRTITLAGSLATKRIYIPTLTNVMTTSDTEWSYYANYQLSAASVGGAAATTIDVDAVSLNSDGVTALLDGLDLLTGTGIMARKADIQTLNVTLASGDFGAANIDLSARTGLYALTAATITRNGAVDNGSPVTITFGSGVGRITDAITTITDPTAVAVADQSSAQDWLAYLTGALNQAGADYTLNLTTLELATDTSQAEADALMTALQALDTTLKAKIDTINIKLAAGNHGAGDITFTGDLRSTNGFQADLKVYVDVAGVTTDGTTQKALAFANGLNTFVDTAANAQGHVSTVADVVLANAFGPGLIDDIAFIQEASFNAQGFITNASNFVTAEDQENATTSIGQAISALTDAITRIQTLVVDPALGIDQYIAAATAALTDDAAQDALDRLEYAQQRVGLSNWNEAGPALSAANTYIETARAALTAAISSNRAVSWAYYLNWLATQVGGIATIDTTAIDLPTQADLNALHTAMAARSDKNTITAIDIQLAAAFGEGTLTIPALAGDFTGLGADSFKIHRNGAANSGSIVSIAYDVGDEAVVQIVDPTRDGQGGNAVTLDNAQHWLEYLTYTLNEANAGYALDLSSLTLTAAGDGTALSSALSALDPALKAKIATLKVKASANVAIDTDFSIGFTALTAIELDKPAVNTITVNEPGTAQLRITDVAKVNKAAHADWRAYIQHLMVGADANYMLDLSALELAAGTSQAEADALMLALQLLNGTLKAKIDTINIKLAAGNHGANPLNLAGELADGDGFTALTRVIVDVTDAETDTQAQKVINWTGLSTAAGVKKVMWVSALESVDYDSANSGESWLAYINYLVSEENAALNTSAINGGNGLTVAQLNTVFDSIATFASNGDNIARLTSVTAKLSTAPELGTFSVNQDLSALSGLTSIIIDATGSMDEGVQVSVGFGGAFHANTTTKEARITDITAVDLDSSDSWTYYLNWLATQAGGIATIDTTAVDLPAQADFTALHTAIAARSDKNTITAIDIQLAAAFGDGTLTIPALAGDFTGLVGANSFKIHRNGATNGGNIVSIAYDAGDETVVQIVDPTAGAVASQSSAQNWLAYLTNTLNAVGADYTLNLTTLELAAGTSQAEADALMAALQALDNSLKAKIDTINIKLAAGNHGAGDITFTGDLRSSNGFQADLKVYVDVAGVTTDGTIQKAVVFANGVNNFVDTAANAQGHVSTVADVVLASALNIDTATLTQDIELIQTGDIVTAQFHITNAISQVQLMSGEDATTAITNASDAVSLVITAIQGLVIHPVLGIDQHIADALAALTDDAAQDALDRLTYAQERVGQADWGEAEGALAAANNYIATANTALQAAVDALALVVLDSHSADSWAYYLNWLATQVGGIASIDLSLKAFTTVEDSHAFFAALDARTSDKASVKDIFVALNGADVDFVIGEKAAATSAAGLTGLTSVIVRNIASNSVTADGTAVEANDLAIIKAATNQAGAGASTLGAAGTVSQWKGYLAYRLEDAAHGGLYTSASPIALDLTAADLQTDNTTTLDALEQALAELPARLKGRVSALVLKTSAASADYRSQSIPTDEVEDLTLPALGTDETAATNWTTWINAYYASTASATIDLTSVSFISQAQLNAFFQGLDNVTNKDSFTRIDINLAGYNDGGVAVFGQDLTFSAVTGLNDALKVMVFNKPGSINLVAPEETGTANQIDTDEVFDLTLPALGTDATAATNWTTWINAYYASTASATIDLTSVSFTTQAQLNAFFEGLGAATNKASFTRIDLDLTGYSGTAILGRDLSALTVSGLHNSLRVNVFGNSGVTLEGDGGATGANDGQINTDEISNLTLPALGTDETAATNWTTWINAYYASTASATIDLTSVSFTSQAQLNAFFEGLGAATNVASFTRIDLDLNEYTDGSSIAAFGRNISNGAVLNLNSNLKVNVSRKPAPITLYGDITYEFGDKFTAPVLAELDELKAVIIDASTTSAIGGGIKPVFDTDGDFFSTGSISKIVY